MILKKAGDAVGFWLGFLSVVLKQSMAEKAASSAEVRGEDGKKTQPWRRKPPSLFS